MTGKQHIPAEGFWDISSTLKIASTPISRAFGAERSLFVSENLSPPPRMSPQGIHRLSGLRRCMHTYLNREVVPGALELYS
jgi:hypothetical protein